MGRDARGTIEVLLLSPSGLRSRTALRLTVEELIQLALDALQTGRINLS
jgi:hypothetical protein